MIKEVHFLFFCCRILQDYPTPTLHDLCTTIPAQKLPVNLHLASRVYHTADKKGHNTLLAILGTSFLDGHLQMKSEETGKSSTGNFLLNWI